MSPEKWEAPPQSVFKLNFDGAEKGKLAQVKVMQGDVTKW